MYYMAYGSNLHLGQMANRCPDAVPVGKGILEGWKLRFRVHATIETEKGSSVPVGIWEISKEDEKSLDRYEGFPRYYYKTMLPVKMKDFTGHEVEIWAMAYIMQEGRPISEPSEYYYQIIKEGYRRFGLPIKPLRAALVESMECECHE